MTLDDRVVDGGQNGVCGCVHVYCPCVMGKGDACYKEATRVAYALEKRESLCVGGGVV